MKNYLALLVLASLVTTSVPAMAQSMPSESKANNSKSAVTQPATILKPVVPSKPILKPELPQVENQATLQSDLVSLMKADGVYTKSVANYVNEFNRILTTYPDRQQRMKQFAKLDKKYPNASKTVRKYFTILAKKPSVPVIIDIPLEPKKEYYALLQEMQLFVKDMAKVKAKLERVEKMLDDLRR